MINVVHVTEDLKIGGLERAIENIAMHLDPQRFKVSVLCLSRGGEIAERLIANEKDVEISGIKNYHSLLSLIKVAKWLKQKRIDIVHTHGYPAGVLGRIAGIIAGVPYILHHVQSTYLDLNKRNHLIEKFLSRFTCKVLCVSDAVRRFVSEKEGIAENKLLVLYNGTSEPDLQDIKVIKNLKTTLGIPPDARVIGCVASLVRHKGHRYLLEAFRKIDGAYLLLVGDGPLRKDLEEMTSEFGLNNRVIFTGYKMDVTPYIQLMDISVLPSTEREGLSVSIIEAMALSKPVVATDVGGNPESVINGHTGILVNPMDSNALSDAINRLLKSPDLTHAMGTNGRERYLKMFTLDRMITNLEKIYEECT